MTVLARYTTLKRLSYLINENLTAHVLCAWPIVKHCFMFNVISQNVVKDLCLEVVGAVLYPSSDNVFLLQRTHHVSEISSHVLPMTTVQEPVKENENQSCLSNNILESVLIILMQKTVNCY